MMKKVKLFFAKMWAYLVSLFTKVDSLVDQYAPIAIRVVEGLKEVNESFKGDLIEFVLKKVIPGDAEGPVIDAVRKKLKEYLPKLILQLKLASTVSQIKDPNDQLIAIVKAINFSPDETKNMFYHGLSTMILEALSDGKLTWSEAVHISEYYYTNIFQK